MISTIREITDLPIVVDANQGWKEKGYALDMIEWLAQGVWKWLNNPCQNYYWMKPPGCVTAVRFPSLPMKRASV